LADDTQRAFIQSRRPSLNDPPPSLEDISAIVQGIGGSLDRTPRTGEAMSGQRIAHHTVRYAIARSNPPARAWVAITDSAVPMFGGQTVVRPAYVRPYSVARLVMLVQIGGLVVWVGLYVVGMRGAASRQIASAKLLLGVSLFCLVSGAGRWRLDAWTNLSVEGGSKIWLVMLVVSILTLLHARQQARRENLRICTSCGYDLWGNTSGKCPECGMDLTAAQKLYVYAMLEEWKELEGKAHS
jgi:hypothetical protein